MKTVDELLEELEFAGVDSGPLEGLWGRRTHFQKLGERVPEPVSVEAMDRRRRDLESLRRDLGESSEIYRSAQAQLLQLEAERQAALRRRQEIAAAEEEARLTAARRTRRVLLEIYARCADEVGRLAAEPCGSVQEFLPEQIVAVYRRGLWAARTLDHPALSVPAEDPTRIGFALLARVPAALREAVEAKCTDFRKTA
ncbi:MAG TPA: hypothetical protein VFC25_06290 [Verrucomicrobiae bacterium]|nr:hypothetical protein [Verrucomicrobiae bacterium]